ncbi:MAG: hypothetical protein AAF655_12105 [Bacteroidota bacterium]
MRLYIPITPYVKKYLAATYGPDPYPVSHQGPTTDLFLQFKYMALNAGTVVKEPGTPKYPHVQITFDDPDLISLHPSLEPLIKSGVFFQHAFYLNMRRFIEGQELLAKEKGLNRAEWNRQQAVKSFLDLFGITEEELSLESAYRHLQRKLSDDQVFFFQKLTKIHEFRPSDNQMFRLGRIVRPNRPTIAFDCYSRSKEDIIIKEHRIPPKLVRANNWQDYAHTAMEVINDFLIKGYSVK